MEASTVVEDSSSRHGPVVNAGRMEMFEARVKFPNPTLPYDERPSASHIRPSRYATEGSTFLQDKASHVSPQVHFRDDHDAPKMASKARLERRAETWSDEDLVRIHHENAKAYRREFAGKKNEEKRKRLMSGIGEKQELERYWLLHDAFYKHKGASRRLRTNAENPRTTTPHLTAAQGEALRPDFNAYLREFERRYNKEELAELKAGRGDPHVLQRFNALYKSAKEFRRWDRHVLAQREQAALDSGLYTPEDLIKLEELRGIKTAQRQNYLDYQRLYRGTAEKIALAARYRAGDGPAIEVERFNAQRNGYNAYRNAHRMMKRLGQLTDIAFIESLRENVQELEELRQDFLRYTHEFGGPENAERRAELEAGQGPTEVVERYRYLRQRHLAYRKQYRVSRENSQSRSARSADDDDDDDDDPEMPADQAQGEGQGKIQGVGRKRYFRQRDQPGRRVKRIKPNALQSIENPGLQHNDGKAHRPGGIIGSPSEHRATTSSCSRVVGTWRDSHLLTSSLTVRQHGSIGQACLAAMSHWQTVSSKTSEMWKTLPSVTKNIPHTMSKASSDLSRHPPVLPASVRKPMPIPVRIPI